MYLQYNSLLKTFAKPMASSGGAERSKTPKEYGPMYGQQEDEFKKEIEKYNVQEEFERLKEECDSFSFLAVGKTGVGKSTLLNALTESNEFLSSSNRREAGTKIITRYQFVRNGVTITAWDSPGFQDGSGKDEVYKKELKEHCSNVDSVLYCISLKETRADLGEDASALKQITDALSVEVWKKCVVVLTFSNTLEKRLKLDNEAKHEELFAERIESWKQKVYAALRECSIKESVINRIQVVPAGHLKRVHLPGTNYWLSNLWIKIFVSVQNELARVAFHKANEDRIVSSKEGEKHSPYAIVLTKEDVATIAAGGTVGAAGAAVGGTTGALIGALALGIPTFGAGAAVGLVLGLVVGGTVGGGVGTGVGALVKKIRAKRRKKDVHKVCE